MQARGNEPLTSLFWASMNNPACSPKVVFCQRLRKPADEFKPFVLRSSRNTGHEHKQRQASSDRSPRIAGVAQHHLNPRSGASAKDVSSGGIDHSALQPYLQAVLQGAQRLPACPELWHVAHQAQTAPHAAQHGRHHSQVSGRKHLLHLHTHMHEHGKPIMCWCEGPGQPTEAFIHDCAGAQRP